MKLLLIHRRRYITQVLNITTELNQTSLVPWKQREHPNKHCCCCYVLYKFVKYEDRCLSERFSANIVWGSVELWCWCFVTWPAEVWPQIKCVCVQPWSSPSPPLIRTPASGQPGLYWLCAYKNLVITVAAYFNCWEKNKEPFWSEMFESLKNAHKAFSTSISWCWMRSQISNQKCIF